MKTLNPKLGSKGHETLGLGTAHRDAAGTHVLSLELVAGSGGA